MHGLSQNETNKWYFGYNGALDFMTNPPSVLANNTMTVDEGCASIADGNGNLLFYTDGMTLWTSTHTIMPNGTGLDGGHSSTQAAIILKKPGSSTVYYVFTVIGNTWFQGLNYTVVDMSLAAGQGSVTAKNVNLFSGSLYEKLTATRHCNGTDFWIVVRDYSASNMSNNGNFHAYQLSSSGVNTTAVTSAFTYTTNFHFIGGMKISPNGRKLACANYNMVMSNNTFELFDFDNSSGVVSNSLALMTAFPNNVNSFFASGYGVEFSPDGTKLYGALGNFYATFNNGNIFQWDLCSGSDSLIAASQKTLAMATGTNYFGVGSMQLASDGKIYVAHSTNSSSVEALSVINNPNAAGLACNFVYGTQTVTSYDPHWGLPNFSGHYFLEHPAPAPFTYTNGGVFGCQGVGFSATPLQNTVASCAASAYSITGYAWNFGDPLSGSTNISFLANPTHTFSGAGTYTTQLVLYYSCSGGTDTLRQVINITGASLIINTASITCASLGSGTVNLSAGSGNYSYMWVPGGHTTSVASGLIPGNYTISVLDNVLNCAVTNSVYFAPLVPLTGTLASSSSVTCYGAGTGSASYASLAGGSPSQYYLWHNGASTYTTPVVNSLSAGTWSSTVTDALTACQVNDVFYIAQPPAPTLNIVSSPTACVGSTLNLTGFYSGGTPNYTYLWSNASTSSISTMSENSSGLFVYSLTGTDANNCVITQTTAVQFIPKPVLSVVNTSICPLETGSLSITGATSYTWNPGTSQSSSGAIFAHSPSVTSTYTVIGSAMGCTNSSTGIIVLKSLPVPQIITNGPVCEGKTLTLGVNTGTNFIWAGANNFSSASKNNTLVGVTLNNNGVYAVTVTAANSCTAITNLSITVKPLPTLQIANPNQTLCVGIQSVNLIANGNATLFNWTPALNISSTNQSSVSVWPGTNKIYTLKGSLNGCESFATATISVVKPPVLQLQLSSSNLCAQPIGGSGNSVTVTPNGAISYTLLCPAFLSNSQPNGAQSVLSTLPPYSSLPTGFVTTTLQGSNGVCTVNYTSNLNILPNPTVTVSDLNPVICAGQSFSSVASGAMQYYWASAQSSVYLATNANTAVASPASNSNFYVFGISSGCYSNTDTIRVKVNPLPSLGVTPASTLLCEGGRQTLTASGTATSFLWSPANSLSANTGNMVIAQPKTNQSYTVIGSLNNCTQVAVVQISLAALPIPTIAVNGSSFCANTEILLTGLGGIGYSWSGPSGFEAMGNTIKVKANSSGQSGTYTLTVSDANQCLGSVSKYIRVFDVPSARFTSLYNNGCAPFCTEFELKTNSPDTKIISGSFFVNENKIELNNLKYKTCFTQAGTYTIAGNYTDENNCQGSTSTQINVWKKPNAEFTFSPPKPITEIDEVTFTSTEKNEYEKWFIESENFTFSTNTNQELKKVFENAGNYPVALVTETEHGCKDTVIHIIRVDEDFTVFVPNAFTPNADGKNETFAPVLRSSTKMMFEVFDRWGHKIFETTDANNGWNGTFEGVECKQDVYIWKLQLNTNEPSAKTGLKIMAGEVTLYR
ncbi:MAG: gliding motility-associated C-terminal domain-containing protein [Bacteroidia bacterium]|nr:gliding motility-associated C-terminal domain-containing protein [Bacteroidia bacterium]